jgi:soluble lytic murein transglycosylase-like protein
MATADTPSVFRLGSQRRPGENHERARRSVTYSDWGDFRQRRLRKPLGSAHYRARAAEATQQAASSPDNRQQYGAIVEQTAGRFGIDAALLHAMISVESGYDPNALSRRGAGGLMQLMPATAKRYGVANVFDPVDNVRGGARYLAELLKMFENDLPLALAAYNAGEAAVLKYGKRIPPYRETTDYVAKVVDSYNKRRSPM